MSNRPRSFARLFLLGAGLLALIGYAASGAGADEPAGKKLEYRVHDGHFERNDTGLVAAVTTHALDTREAFDKLFGVAAFMGRKQKFVDTDAFKTRQVVAVVHRGADLWEYDVQSVEQVDDAIVVKYRATKLRQNGSARFAVPLILSIERGSAARARFIENGKELDAAKFAEK